MATGGTDVLNGAAPLPQRNGPQKPAAAAVVPAAGATPNAGGNAAEKKPQGNQQQNQGGNNNQGGRGGFRGGRGGPGGMNRFSQGGRGGMGNNNGPRNNQRNNQNQGMGQNNVKPEPANVEQEGGNKMNQGNSNPGNQGNKMNQGGNNQGGNKMNQSGNQGGGHQGNQGGHNQGGMKRMDNNRGGMDRRGNNNFDGERGGNDRRGGGGGGGFDRRGGRGGNDDFMINQKLKNLTGPTHDLPNIEAEEIKFSGRNRLYLGNLTNDITEEELTELFKPYGEISEAFVNKEKNFAFLKVDYHANAEKAKRELDGSLRKNRQIRIRFAPNATTVRVKNLTHFVSNELLYKSFEIFGPIERAVIIVDDRGRPTGEGIVEYARKAGAMTALRLCNDKCFFLTSSLRPCVVEPFDHIDDTDGYSEKSLNKKNQDFYKARQFGPRFAEMNSFEHEYGTRWKQLHELYKTKHEALKREMQLEEEKLEAQMEYARYEHETEILREQLLMREGDRDRQKVEFEMKKQQAEEFRTQEEDRMRRQNDEMQVRMSRQEEELRRRQQENTLFMQAQQLNSLLDAQEMNQGGNIGGNGGNRNNKNQGNDNRRNFDMMNQGGGNGGNNSNMDPAFMDFDQGQNNRQSRFDGEGGQGGGNGGRGGNRQWNDRGGDNFQNKRRRF